MSPGWTEVSWWSRWDSNPPAVWKQRSFAVQPGLLGYRKERKGILSAPLMPPKIPEVRAGPLTEQTRPSSRKDIRHGMLIGPLFADASVSEPSPVQHVPVLQVHDVLEHKPAAAPQAIPKCEPHLH